jgi:hypothetical protein
MTALWFAGAEQAANRNLLADCGVSRYALNATNLARVVKKLDAWNVADHLPDDAEWLLYADQGTTWPMVEPLIGQVPSAPYWNEGLEPGLDYVALLDAAVKRQSTLRQVLSQHGQSTLVAVTGASRGVERLDVVVSSAWLEAQRHGETQVWAGNKLHRYPNSQKAEARQRHFADIERLGIDPEKVADDDPKESTRLAVVSWQEWEDRHARRDNLVVLSSSPTNGQPVNVVSNQAALARPPVQPRHDSMLPTMALEPIQSRYKDAEGREVIEETSSLVVRAESSRACDTCYLARNCPAFNPGHACAYAIPVEIRTKDQLQAAMRALVEMQAQRVLFARFAEELDGQGVDATVSSELERFFRVLKDMRDVSDTRDVLRLEMEARAGAGVLSRLFGADVGHNARAVTVPMDADEVLEVFDPDE